MSRAQARKNVGLKGLKYSNLPRTLDNTTRGFRATMISQSKETSKIHANCSRTIHFPFWVTHRFTIQPSWYLGELSSRRWRPSSPCMSALEHPTTKQKLTVILPCWCSAGNEGMTLVNHPLWFHFRGPLGSFPHSLPIAPAGKGDSSNHGGWGAQISPYQAPNKAAPSPPAPMTKPPSKGQLFELEVKHGQGTHQHLRHGGSRLFQGFIFNSTPKQSYKLQTNLD